MKLYAIFHLNLFYSSIEEEQRPEVLRRCYWPLLRVVKDLKLPLGIEASGYTLELASEIDPQWVTELRKLIKEGLCEWIGSGYTQLIGPLVPADVNAKNLQLGNETYEQLLGVRPQLAFVNEQAYSAGLIRHYLDAGYRAIVMEWENPFGDHPEWAGIWKYYPQLACGIGEERMPVIWNQSFAFQKLQRYAHGELTQSEYVEYLGEQCGNQSRAFSIYGNDAEIFDFRPGRFATESPLHPDGEWRRLQQLFEFLQQDSRFEWVAPRDVLTLQKLPEANHSLRLESLANPIPVKKQPKYNVLRWSVTGKDDAWLNTYCWRSYKQLKSQNNETPQAWKDLCYLWSSDFRTHITQKRWEEMIRRLKQSEGPSDASFRKAMTSCPFVASRVGHSWSQRREDHYLILENDNLRLQLNCAKGLAIHGLWIKALSDCPLIGTLPHGYYQNVALGADYFSGHLVFETPVQTKVTDLCPVDPQVKCHDGVIAISGTIQTRFGEIEKCFQIGREGFIRLFYNLRWKKVPPGALRLGHITLNPLAFQYEQLELKTRNGGHDSETFPIHGRDVDHCRPVSFLVSANNGFGNTEGRVVLTDQRVWVQVDNSQAEGYLIPQLTTCPIAPSYFCRVSFSAMEFDDTTRGFNYADFCRTYAFSIQIRQSSAVFPSNNPPTHYPQSTPTEVVC